METIFYYSLAVSVICGSLLYFYKKDLEELNNVTGMMTFYILAIATLSPFFIGMIILGRWVFWESLYQGWVQEETCNMVAFEYLTQQGQNICKAITQ